MSRRTTPLAKDAQLMIRVTPAFLRRLDALARDKQRESGVDVSRSSIVRMLLEEGLDRHRPTKT